jgi:hypothetical protein
MEVDNWGAWFLRGVSPVFALLLQKPINQALLAFQLPIAAPPLSVRVAGPHRHRLGQEVEMRRRNRASLPPQPAAGWICIPLRCDDERADATRPSSPSAAADLLPSLTSHPRSPRPGEVLPARIHGGRRGGDWCPRRESARRRRGRGEEAASDGGGPTAENSTMRARGAKPPHRVREERGGSDGIGKR